MLVPGHPVPWARPRFVRRGKFLQAFIKKEVQVYAKLISDEAIKKMGELEPFDEALSVYVGVYLEIPKSFSKKKREEALSGKLRPVSRPDIDNYAKIAFDSINKIVYRDDSAIVNTHIEKRYAEKPQLEIWVYPVNTKENIFKGF